MPNSHGTPDSLFELQAVSGDLLPACVISQTFPSVPVPPGMTLAAFATSAYIREGPALVYTRQEAQPLTLTGADGTYWVGISTDTWTDFAQWTRQPGTHYLWRPNSTQPADVDSLLCFLSCTVSGGAITAVTPIANANAPILAQQNANAVAITGGTVLGLAGWSMQGGQVQATPKSLSVSDQPGNDVAGLISAVNAAGGSNRWGVYCYGTAPSYLGGTLQVVGTLGLGKAPGVAKLDILHQRAGNNGITIFPDTDSAGTYAIGFVNAASSYVGGISCTATTTTYGTTSDVRLKRNIAPLTDSLAVLAQLNPVSFRWNSTDEADIGFLAHQLMTVAPNAVQGLPDEVNADGSIKPQQVDHSKLVPILTSAIKELLARIEALEAAILA